MDMLKKSRAATEAARHNVRVRVAIVDDGDPPTFEMSADPPFPVKKVRHEGHEEWMLTFNNHQGGSYGEGFKIRFELEDRTGKDYGFFIRDPGDPDANDAMSVRLIGPNGHCPRRGSKWEGFTPLEVTDERRTLIVDNPNDHLQYFGFALHFSLDGQAKPSLSFDPIGDDQNGQAR